MLRLQSDRGITIIETTVILSVLFILAGAMSPIVSESVNTARAVKAKNDAGMIAMALVNFQKDLGSDAVALAGLTAALQSVALPEVLASDGTAPEVGEDQDGDAAAEDLLSPLLTPGQGRGNGGGNRIGQRAAERITMRQQRRRWREVGREAINDHLTTNRKGYKYREAGEFGGWAGPYLSATIKSDPWGNQYLINTGFLDGSATPVDAQGRTRRAVFVVSPGANGAIDTPFEQPIVDAKPFADDIAVRIQ
jgi:type II secretory pathway pseudopilin PulG